MLLLKVDEELLKGKVVDEAAIYTWHPCSVPFPVKKFKRSWKLLIKLFICIQNEKNPHYKDKYNII